MTMKEHDLSGHCFECDKDLPSFTEKSEHEVFLRRYVGQHGHLITLGFHKECLRKYLRRDAILNGPASSHTRNSVVLADFAKYCETHPNERFWQALRNWSDHSAILVTTDYNSSQTVDTFYWENKQAAPAEEGHLKWCMSKYIEQSSLRSYPCNCGYVLPAEERHLCIAKCGRRQTEQFSDGLCSECRRGQPAAL